MVALRRSGPTVCRHSLLPVVMYPSDCRFAIRSASRHHASFAPCFGLFPRYMFPPWHRARFFRFGAVARFGFHVRVASFLRASAGCLRCLVEWLRVESTLALGHGFVGALNEFASVEPRSRPLWCSCSRVALSWFPGVLSTASPPPGHPLPTLHTRVLASPTLPGAFLRPPSSFSNGHRSRNTLWRTSVCFLQSMVAHLSTTTARLSLLEPALSFLRITPTAYSCSDPSWAVLCHLSPTLVSADIYRRAISALYPDPLCVVLFTGGPHARFAC